MRELARLGAIGDIDQANKAEHFAQRGGRGRGREPVRAAGVIDPDRPSFTPRLSPLAGHREQALGGAREIGRRSAVPSIAPSSR